MKRENDMIEASVCRWIFLFWKRFVDLMYCWPASTTFVKQPVFSVYTLDEYMCSKLELKYFAI